MGEILTGVFGSIYLCGSFFGWGFLFFASRCFFVLVIFVRIWFKVAVVGGGHDVFISVKERLIDGSFIMVEG